MDRAVTFRRFASWSVLGVAVAIAAAVELVIAVDLLATGDYSGWNNWPIGVVYVAAIGLVGVRAATRRVTLGRATLELLALDVIALPVAAIVLSA